MAKLAGITLSVLLLSAVGFLPYHADAQTPKYLTYENKQYGFSLKYPSDLKKTETLTKSDEPFPNSISIVSFTTPSELTSIRVALIKDDTIFKGLSGQKFLDKMKNEFKSSACSAVSDPTLTCSMEVLYEQQVQSTNGYVGYISTYAFTTSNNQDSQKIAILVVMYPDGNNVWLLGANISRDEDYKGIGDEISKIVDSLKINNYQGSASQSSTIAKSSVGLLQINSGNFAVSKYKPAELIVSGQINNPLQGVPLTLKITKPDKTTEEQNILVTKDGNFRVPIKIDGTWPAGSYQISAKYGTQDLGTISFQVNTGDTKTTPAPVPTQTTKYLSYENNQYGFSVKYPSDWQKTESLERDPEIPNRISIVSFSSQGMSYSIGFRENDSTYRELGYQQFLDAMKKELTDSCKSVNKKQPGSCQNIEFGESDFVINNKGYSMYYVTLAPTMILEEQSYEPLVTAVLVLDGKDLWEITGVVTFAEQIQQYTGVISEMGNSFTIFDYEGEKKQFSLQSKASQKNDIVYLVIKNPKDSSDDIYSIKLTNTNGKITNFIKIKGWNYVRLGSDSIMYQTMSLPLDSSDMIKVKLKVDSKNTEFQWEAFSKDQKSLGAGKVKP